MNSSKVTIYRAGARSVLQGNIRDFLIGALLFPSLSALHGQTPQPTMGPRGPEGPQGLTLTTSAFEDGGIIPDRYTANARPFPISPALQWSHVPAGTISFARIILDPDNPHTIGEETLHWMIFDIPGTTTQLPEGVPALAQLPDGSIQTLNLGHKYGYLGPGAWSSGPYHHYTFELFALDTKLNLTSEATRADFRNAINGHVIGKGVVVGRFHR